MSPQREPDSARDLAAEQDYVSLLYRKLDTERETAQRRLAAALHQRGSAPQALTERDVATTTYSERLAQLGSVEQGLCFGRLDFQEGETAYVGRLGLFDEDGDYEPLLLDWRAPAARPFYLATAASPEGVRRRRHIRTLSRKVVALDDEILDLRAADQGQDLGLAGEAALLAALERRRTGEMSDIVATIQAEQDRIIRDELGGVLVVQGGPGTGKTAVALHRAAYLLYTYRQQLATRGVLVVGPNSTFLRYIGQVLPSLGETGVLLSTVDQLFPGVRATGEDTREAAEIKGRAVMVDVLTAAVADRQQVPDEVLEVEFEDGILELDRETCERARAKARATRRPHNLARRVFLDQLLDALAERAAGQLEVDLFAGVPEIPLDEGESADAEVLDAGDHADIRAELAASGKVLAALDALWPKLTPQRLLRTLFASPGRLASAAHGHLTEAEQAHLVRPPKSRWTPADVPLLDELAELLGVDDTEERAERERREREERAYAEGVLDILEQDEELADEEFLRVGDILDAELFAERQQARSELTAAERAARDRRWTFGHVIVDEAQELSPLAWRLLMRRCPSRSMTLVGDVAQTGAPAGASSWAEMLAPYVEDRWRLRELTVNYRTPAEIMDLAAGALARVNPELRAPTSVRESGTEPWQRPLAGASLPSLVEEELRAADGGTVAVLCPAARFAALRAELPQDERLSLLTVDEAKGLEFDGVLVVAPEEVVAASPRGWNDLYVALTRATKRLGVVYTERALEPLVGAG
ncbi:DNA helicase IV [Amycolatopsis bartoniae]|uniref:HelD family protein n=1 Tax=Amycolatopsis bartoniae TaxID=941986 RepID=UPI001196B374|nr:ATP-binding domain-containing protein [Amycolatopsis bartoniae]MBB2939216.1 DNA helicase IV [Amycolatopsis bartoniae]TVT09586.1 AAA family ATPase [Amycolatopsis bartoniae]